MFDAVKAIQAMREFWHGNADWKTFFLPERGIIYAGCSTVRYWKSTRPLRVPSWRSVRTGRLYINENLVAVELLNAGGTPTPAAMLYRHMLVTDLHKTSQPIIRYALNRDCHGKCTGAADLLRLYVVDSIVFEHQRQIDHL